MVTNLGRTALTIGLKAIGLERGAGVILPTLICPTVIRAVLQAGCRPILVDVERNLHLSVKILDSCQEKAHAVVVPHLYGLCAPVQEIREWSKGAGLYLIDDAAQAVGISTNGKYLGTFGDFGILSFGPFKSLSTVRGGALISENGDLIKKAKENIFPNEGIYWPIRRVLGSIIKFHLRPYYLRFNRKLNSRMVKSNNFNHELNQVGMAGEAFQLSNLEVQLVRSALSRTASVITGRRRTAHEIWKLLKQFDKFEFVASDIPLHVKIPIRLHGGLTAEHAVRIFRSMNVEAEQIYYPLHLYRKYAHYASQPLPMAEDNWKRVILIPNPGGESIFGINRLAQAFKLLSKI
jgi:dTDP-4-amino-4,6-dideoxygalactose transaminase